MNKNIWEGKLLKFKEINIDTLKQAEKDLAKWKKTYARIFKIAKKVHEQIIEYRKQSKDENEFIYKSNRYKKLYKKGYEHKFIDFFINHYTSKIVRNNKFFLELDKDLKTDPFLAYPPIILQPDISNHENKMRAIKFLIHNGNFQSNELDELLKTDLYKRFESILLNNPELIDWFDKFVGYIIYNFDMQIAETEKLFGYLEMVYDNLSKENEIRLLDNIGKKDEEYIINFIKIKPKIWTKFFKIVDSYGKKMVKGSKEKSHDYISRVILKDNVSAKNVNDMISKLYKKERNEKKRLKIANKNKDLCNLNST